MSVTGLDAVAFRWLEEAVGPGSRLIQVAMMPRAQMRMLAVDVEGAGGAVMRLVLRRYHDAERLASDPWYSPANEASALQLLEGTTVPAPRLIATDLEGAVFGVPTLLTTRLPGSVVTEPEDLDDYLTQMALVLPTIHAVSAHGRVPEYEPYVRQGELVMPAWSSRPELWEHVFAMVVGPAPPTRECFIHRDFHPWNVLWVDGRLTGIVDWPTAAWGPPGIDLARMRLDLTELGPDAAERFRRIHAAVTGEASDRHPFWDLLDAADFTLDAEPPADANAAASWERFESWVASAAAEM